MRRSFGFLLFVSVSLVASAGTYWSPALSDWRLYLDNGVVYIAASNMPAHCQYARAQIDTSTQVYSPTYQRDIYAYVMAAHVAGKPLSIVLNDQESTCKVYGANDQP